MQLLFRDNSDFLTPEIQVISVPYNFDSTVNSVQTPKFAIAPIPNVPTTPAARASGLFFPLDPAVQ